MPLFRFKVATADGRVETQLVEGDSQNDATRRLQARGLLPVEFLGEGSARGPGGGSVFARRRFDIVDFTDRLVPLLEANIPLEQALGIVSSDSGTSYADTVIAELRRGLHEGRRLSQMLRDRRHIFPELYASLVEAGEESGALSAIMKDLREFLLRRRELAGYVVSASIYPVVVFAVSLLVMGFLLGVIVPRFATMLIAAGIEPTFSTRFLIGLSSAVRSYWWLAPLLVVAAVAALRQTRRTQDGQRHLDAFTLKIPLVGKLVLYSNLARMARTMSILMRGGVHILDTVTISSRVLQNSALRSSLAGVIPDLRRGERLAKALGQADFLPPYMLKMIAVGEETGNVESMLERVSDRFEGELRKLVARGLALLEPAVIIVLGLIVGLIVVTMFLAIMQLQGSLG